MYENINNRRLYLLRTVAWEREINIDYKSNYKKSPGKDML